MICILSLLIPAQVVAGGNPEVGLPKVDRLIKEKNYNQAILELATYMSENPDDFDGAQRRLKRIIDMRVAYNNKALELLLVLANEPTNDQKKLDMITYMESLEKNPNAATSNFILDTKAAAQFTYYRAKFDEIMQQGDSFIDQGKYIEAARKFSEGFVFYKQEFDDASDPSLVSQVNSSLGNLTNLVATYSEIQNTFPAAVSAYNDAVSAGNAVLVESCYVTLAAELQRFSIMRNQIATNGWFFSDSFAVLQKQNNLVTENSFLPFAFRFTLGRTTAGHFEGILGSCDAQWNAALDILEKTVNASLGSLWTSGFTSLKNGDVVSGMASLDTARRILVTGTDLESSLSQFTFRSDTFGRRDYSAVATRFSHTGDLLAISLSLGKQYADYLTIEKNIVGYVEEPASRDVIRKNASNVVSTYNTTIADLDLLSGNIKTQITSAASITELSPYTGEFRDWSLKFDSMVSAEKLSVYIKLAGYQADSSVLIVDETTALYNKALSLLDGIPRTDSTLVDYFPSESIVAFNALKTGISSDRASLLSIIATLSKAPASIGADKAYAAGIARLRSDVASLDRMNTDASNGIARANARVLQANLAKQESNLRYSQAQAALKKNDFQTARDNLQRARDKINQSLEYQADLTLRAKSDTNLENLGTEITRIENEQVVKEVRTLISSGKNLYYLGNVDQAEQVFLQAKTRWAVTNIEGNPEVTNWLDIINTALSMKTGRTIPVSAPLYPQMSQILNTANQLFNDGKAQMLAGKRTAAIATLTEAKTQLQQLQLVYPLNQDAGQLTLKINQLIDPFSFTTFFKQKIDTIRASYKTDKQNSYSDLLDLYQLNPAYPGIKKLVDEVEIYLGIQIPPPDPKSLARSTELTKSAQKIYDANTRSQFQVALDQLEEAIKLNPNNQTAIALKDRVQTASGGQSVAVLSADDESKYQQAVAELQKGNKITASALVGQLMLNPKSKNSSKIQDLKKRIDSQL